jgi:hypothetical protein
MSSLSNRGDRGNGSCRNLGEINFVGAGVVDIGLLRCVLLRAVAGNVASLTASVAGLAGSVEWAAVGSCAIAGDVTELATSVALHGLSLAIAGKVVGTTALVASGRTRTAREATTAITASKSAAAHRSTTAHGTDRVGASTSEVTGLAAVVAPSAGTSAAQAQGRAISLDVAKTLAVVALLSLSGARQRAAVGLVAGLLAVVAKTLSGRAHFSVVANIAALVARASGERRHLE